LACPELVERASIRKQECPYQIIVIEEVVSD